MIPGPHARQKVGVIVHQLQKPLDTRRAMIWPLPVVAVRQQHYKSALLAPPLLAGRNELINDDLREEENETETKNYLPVLY